MITINETVVLPATSSEVWAVLSDPYQVINCVADAEILAENPDGTYDGKLTVRFGPMRVNFKARVELQLDPENHSGNIVAQGNDSQGGTRMRTIASFKVLPTDDSGATTVDLNGDVELAGRLAAQIEGAAGSVVKRMTADFAEALKEKLAPKVEETNVPGAKASLGNRIAAWFRRLLRHSPSGRS